VVWGVNHHGLLEKKNLFQNQIHNTLDGMTYVLHWNGFNRHFVYRGHSFGSWMCVSRSFPHDGGGGLNEDSDSG
jgi:hypothetical protein